MRAGVLPKLLLSPSVLLLLVCVYGYIMFTVYLSFTSSTLMPVYDWAGPASYHRLFGLENWSVSLGNLVVFAGLYIGIAIVLGLGFAILIDQRIRAEGLFRSVFLYPMALSFIVTGTVWKWVLNPGIGLEHAMHQLGWAGFRFGWIVDPDLAIYTIVVAGIWQSSGLVLAIFLAALRGMDQDVVKAAFMDGASTLQIYWGIVLPSIRPAFFSAVVVLTHLAVKSFDLVVAMTSGGPGYATDLPAIFMYSMSFQRNNIAVGSATAMMMLCTVMAIIVPYLYSELRPGRQLHG